MTQTAHLKLMYGEYLEHSLRYYEFDAPVISDHEFDHICLLLAAGWNLFEHKYKHLTTKDDLWAGTGMQISSANAPRALLELIRKYPDKALKDVFNVTTPCVVCSKPKRWRNAEGKCTDCAPIELTPPRDEPKKVENDNRPGKKTA